MPHKSLRVPVELAEEITRRACIKGVADADYYRLLIERAMLGKRRIGDGQSTPPGLLGPMRRGAGDPQHLPILARCARAQHDSERPSCMPRTSLRA